jgi:hypothetical protein
VKRSERSESGPLHKHTRDILVTGYTAAAINCKFVGQNVRIRVPCQMIWSHLKLSLASARAGCASPFLYRVEAIILSTPVPSLRLQVDAPPEPPIKRLLQVGHLLLHALEFLPELRDLIVNVRCRNLKKLQDLRLRQQYERVTDLEAVGMSEHGCCAGSRGSKWGCRDEHTGPSPPHRQAPARMKSPRDLPSPSVCLVR